jgi:hypothetical protein
MVYKARSKKDNSIMALKKILMHHEKEGVSIHLTLPRQLLLTPCCYTVPNYCNSRDQVVEGAFSSKYLAAQGDGRGADQG